MSKYLSFKHRLKLKKTNTQAQAEGWYPQNYVKTFVTKISTDTKKNYCPNLSNQKINFGGPHFGGCQGQWPQNLSGDKIAFAAQQLCTTIRF